MSCWEVSPMLVIIAILMYEIFSAVSSACTKEKTMNIVCVNEGVQGC